MNDTPYTNPRLLIAGTWRDGQGRDTLPVINPATGEALGAFPVATPADVNDALQAAAEGFEHWRRVPALERSRVLRQAAALLRQRREPWARLITLELGKPYPESLRETETACEMFEWAAEECRRSYGRLIPPRQPGIRQMATREPVGPVVAIAGWNAPAITPSRKLAGALAAGCSVILKPAEATPSAALFIAQALLEAGLPPAALSVLLGDPAPLTTQLLDSPIPRMVTFTGSVPVGKQLATRAIGSMKRMVMELGGHSPVLVFDDVDLEAVLDGAVAAKYRNAGQICVAPTRFYVQEALYERFVEGLATRARAWRVGDPFAAGTQMGPLQNARRVAAMQHFVQDARGHGLAVAAGGERIGEHGCFFQPTVLAGDIDACLAGCDEVFGPIALVSPFRDLEDGLARANRLPFGLGSYVFTRDVSRARAAADGIRAGNVIVNHWVVSLPETPFGGMNDSGTGLEGGIEGLQAFEQLKYVSEAA